MSIRLRYFGLTLALLLVETGIALFVHDGFVRPFVGDVLVVVLIYCGLRCLVSAPARPLALAVLALACVVEGLQGLDFVARLGLQEHRVLSVVLGRTFSWLDFLAYGCGFAMIVGGEAWAARER